MNTKADTSKKIQSNKLAIMFANNLLVSIDRSIMLS